MIASGDELLPLSSISLATFRHDMMLIDLAIRLEQETGGKFLPDRRIRFNEGLSGVGQLGHIPDGYLYIGDDKPIAIELELTVKSRAQLQNIVNQYGGDLGVKEVWYFTSQPDVARAIEDAANGYSFIKVIGMTADKQEEKLVA